MTSSAIFSDFTSSPCILATTWSIIVRICSSLTGRLPHARLIDLSTFDLSNGWREPSVLTTWTSSRSTSSYVVKRCPQAAHSRRRRMAAPSRAVRESSTLSSSTPHLGHFIVSPRVHAASVTSRRHPRRPADPSPCRTSCSGGSRGAWGAAAARRGGARSTRRSCSRARREAQA